MFTRREQADVDVLDRFIWKNQVFLVGWSPWESPRTHVAKYAEYVLRFQMNSLIDRMLGSRGFAVPHLAYIPFI